MKNPATRILILSISLIGILAYFFCCPTQKELPTSDRFEEKHEPSDEFFMQRANLDGTFAFKAYTDGLKAAKQTAEVRTIDGFEEEWTTQGPGNIGARANIVTVNPIDNDIIYAGFSGGGVFKTTDGGATWNSIFDDQVFLAIGEITLDPVDPNIVYVGTGDVNINGYTFLGDGLWRSMDGGETWTNLGLEEQRIISKVIIDPTNSNNIFAATMGVPFVRDNNRGLYRSTDNGSTWEQILFLSDSTGIIDMVMNPNDPQMIYAVGWDRIRNNVESIIRGTGAKVYKTIDGGDTWETVEGGLPNNEPHGRMGLAMYEADPNIIYVQYVGTNSQLEAIYRTDDGGENWYPIPIDEDQNGLNDNSMGGFGWYFGKIRVSPTDPDDIYLLGIELWRTRDAGNAWERATPEWWLYDVHADKHDLTYLQDGGVLLATDGGLYRSDFDNEIWEDIENIPTTQFYRVAYNPHDPNQYYGGAQDNGTTGGNADDINGWDRIFGGDGFQPAFDPDNPDRFFVETQRGNINVTLDGGFNFSNATSGLDGNESRNWDMPYFISTHDPLVLYTGRERVYMGFGENPEWSPISEDLSDGIAVQHRYHHITAIHESPIVEGLLYAGTGDGNVWRRDDAGASWILLSENLPDQYVTNVTASPSNDDVVYVTHSGYRENDFLPRIHRSMDKGLTWEDISSNLPDLAINELEVLPETGDSIMFVATDGGVYGTVSAGTEWERLGSNMPVVAVYDIVVNEAKNELVAGTFARSIMSYPLDSIFVEDDPTVSIENPDLKKVNPIKVFPNPVSEMLQIEFQNIEQGRAIEFVVVSADGKLMYQFEKTLLGKVNHQLDVSIYPAGQYFVKAKMRHQILSTSFVKI